MTKRYRPNLRRVGLPHARPNCKAIRPLTAGYDLEPVRYNSLWFHQSGSISLLSTE